MIVETNGADYAALLLGHAPRHFTLADTAIAPAEILRMLADLAARISADFTPASWLIVEADEVVGLCSVTRPPVEGVIDIGYGVAPSRQGRGFAGRAVRDIVAWAREDPRVQAITADTSPDNLPSRRVLAAAGFVQVGERIDAEDGLVLCWRCATA
ncbi:GNAT family N-acetyltransferase [Sphingomonas sp. R-74633]|uniref:GNAT family N-acetyltransferase n=1 Tax=Sphingomonas sp. R-74633 TaxID=2751188 RepID=UPI0015D26F85|nr:GNAT family protein [Sphingomonas sp. R-74633]NYT41850.1 GNAT family N-acetyltransferase [Sphingomonas sp. R-74633]